MICYFAQFIPERLQKGTYSVYFPDLPGCVTFGENLEDSMQSAMDVLTEYLEIEMSGGEELPPPSDFATAKAKAEAAAKELDIAIPPDTLYLLIPAEPRTERFVRVNITMPPRLVAQIDRQATMEGMTRSGFLSLAVKKYMGERGGGGKGACRNLS